LTTRILKHILLFVGYGALFTTLAVAGFYIKHLQDRDDLRPWHLVEFDSEFSVASNPRVDDFDTYLQIEQAVFEQLQSAVYDAVDPPDRRQLHRYSAGSLADPRHYPQDWNRTFELSVTDPRGVALLLHGLSDSPYSLRALGEQLHASGFWVLGLRLPGHGTAPAGLVAATWEDFAAATRLAARHLRSRVPDSVPFIMVGYSNGAALAVEYSLAVLEGEPLPPTDALILLSPAIGVYSVTALAVWQSRLAAVPGLEKLAWNSIAPEYDPYKYNSFAINAGDQIYQLTVAIAKRLQRLSRDRGYVDGFPRVLAFQSVVDATIPAIAVVDRLLQRLTPDDHQLVLFDINRQAEAEPFLVSDPETLTQNLVGDDSLPFALTLVTNETPHTAEVAAFNKPELTDTVMSVPLGLRWPSGVVSLSHVALPFPPDDPIYGVQPDTLVPDMIHLGMLEARGETGTLLVPSAQLVRLRHNPFFSYLSQRVDRFIAEIEEAKRRPLEAEND